MASPNSVHIISLASLGQGISGGDRIYIELARRWGRQYPVTIYVWEEGLAMCRRQKLTGPMLNFNLVKVGKLAKLGFIFTYFYRIWLGVKLGLTLKLNEGDLVYSGSEFWMDALPAWILKLRHRVNWVAAWYQTAPNPLVGYNEGLTAGRYRFKALLYWLVQQPIRPLISRWADFVLVNNEAERDIFPELEKRDRVVVLIGAVDVARVVAYKKKHPEVKKRYLGVFQGRFHPQKGVVELVDIWNLVVQHYPAARLAMIGDGPLMMEVRAKIKQFGLTKNIDLLGYVYDGDQKYRLFAESEIVLHPAFFDSGGMAAAEAMIFGLPCVGFDLKSYASYYPQGMKTVPVGDIEAFSQMIIKLKTDKKLYKQTAQAAQSLIEEKWSWDQRAEQILTQVTR